MLGVDNVLLAVGDFDRAREFYAEKLGLPLKFEFAPAGIAGFRLGNEEPGLMFRVRPPTAMAIWLEVADARETAERLRAAGLEVGEPREISTGWVVEVVDPWGNTIGFTDYAKDPARGRKKAKNSRLS